MQLQKFTKIFENITSIFCRECQTLSPDMRTIFLLSIMKEEQAFFLLVLQTTDGQTYTVSKSPRHTDSNGIL